MSLKKQIGKLIPYPLIAGGRKVVHFGPHRCEVCGSAFRRRIDTGYGYPVLEQLKVVGGLRRPADACPICHSSSRERLIWFYLERHFAQVGPDQRIAHFAPEKGLSAALRQRFPKTYQAYDLAPQRYRHLDKVTAANLETLPIETGSVDLFLCNHVLEHVYDLPKCLSEIARVLAPTGLAIMQVPIALGLEATIDGGQSLTAQERIERFGQDDHVRLFTAQGYAETLASAGFETTPFRAFAAEPVLATGWSLDPFEELILIRKPAGNEGPA